MPSTVKARLTGLGSYLPAKVLSNHDLEKLIETSDEWITSRTGIKERRIANSRETPSHMGTEAALIAIEAAHLTVADIGLILVATSTPDYRVPATATLIQSQLKATNIPAFDIQAACTGYIYALSIAKAYVESGMYNHILVVATEKMSSITNYEDRNTCILFGDGASAAVVSSKGKGLSIETISLGADGDCAHLIQIPAGGAKEPITELSLEKKHQYLKMEGKTTFKHAVRRMDNAIDECFKKSHIKEDEISWIVPHQANIRILEALAEYTHHSMDKVYKTIHKYGNTSASSIGIALDELMQQEHIKHGEHLLLVAFGAGLTWGAAILTKQSH